MKKSVLAILLLVLFTSCSTKTHKISIDNLTCEYLKNPLGVDVSQPRFSWKIISEERGVSQSAYQIIVGENPDDVNNESGNIWDSGKVTSDATVNIEYNGQPLQSNKKYFWRVKVWSNSDDAIWSESASFHTSILKEDKWEAKWITAKEKIEDASPLFRKEFSIDKKVKNAYAFVTACGFYEMYINGQKVGDHVLDPAITDYRKTILYSTFDITRFLKEGVNAVGAMLGNGAYNMRKTENRFSWGREDKTLGKSVSYRTNQYHLY